MQLDKKTLDSILSQEDTVLWNTIRAIAAQSGLNLPQNPPPKNELDKLRGILGNKTQLDVGEALKIANNFKRSH